MSDVEGVSPKAGSESRSEVLVCVALHEEVVCSFVCFSTCLTYGGGTFVDAV